MLAQQALDLRAISPPPGPFFPLHFFQSDINLGILQNPCDQGQLTAEEGEALCFCTVVKQVL